MSTLRRVRTGDKLRIPAGDWNACMDAAKAHLARRENLGAALRPASPESAIVPIKNESGADRARFDVLGVIGPLFTPTDNAEEFLERVALRGTTPSAEHVGAFAILLEPLRANEIGRAILNGLTLARVRMADESHRYADVYAGYATELQSAASGLARLLWIQPPADRDDPYVAWTVARLGGAGAAAIPLRVYGEMVNYLICWPASEAEPPAEGWIFVAKPRELRQEAKHYLGVTSVNSLNAYSMQATDGTTTETWAITPRYQSYFDHGGERAPLIYAIADALPEVLNPSSELITLVDMNVAGRQWAKVL